MKSRCRDAVTLIEVVFAMGVILIGLLGLMSVLPLAGQRAQDSISLSVGPAIADQVVKQLQAKQYLSNGRLRPVPATTSAAVTNLTATTPSSFCIDPIFASSTNLPSSLIGNGYSASTFPYYKTTHNPLGDPSTASTTSFAQPRMIRVGIARQTATATFVSVAEALAIVESVDDVLVTRPDDKTLNATFRDSEVAIATGSLEYGKRLPRGSFTWFATVNPLPDGVYASLSVVVLKNRVRDFDTPTTTTAPSTPEENSIGERLAYVTYASGFSGGAGGTVHLVSSANTVNELRSDDWVMLSRDVGGGTIYHRWYRVVGVNGKATEYLTDGTTATDDTNLNARLPSSGQTVWRHKVLLDGPDWHFGFLDSSATPRDYADGSFGDNTYATILSGVVSVTERIVLLSDL